MSEIEDEPAADAVLAGEYALGLLDRDERAAAEARSEQDPEFAADIFSWIRRLAALIEAVPPASPSPQLWTRIEEGLERKTPPHAVEAAPPPVAANDDLGSVTLWRTWAAAASAIAAVALLAIGYIELARPASDLRTASGPHGPTLVATLGLTEGGAPAATIAYDPGRGTLYAAPDADFSIPKARSAELWLIPEDGKPRAMGVIDPSKPGTMPMPPEFRNLANDRAKLALSIEPEGGSRTGAPTGPVVAVGALTQV